MKKNNTRVTIIILVFVVGIVGFYAYLLGNSRNAANKEKTTAVQEALSKDLKSQYPSTPKQVVTYFTEIQKCYYNEECTDEEIEQLSMKAWELFDPELQAANEGIYETQLKADIITFKNNKRRIASVLVQDSANVDYSEEKPVALWAWVTCTYHFSENGKTSSGVEVVYLLHRDVENRKWRIYGWEDAENVNRAD